MASKDASALLLYALHAKGKMTGEEVMDVKWLDPRKEFVVENFSLLCLSSVKQPVGIFCDFKGVSVESSLVANPVDVLRVPFQINPSIMETGGFEFRLNIMSSQYGYKVLRVKGYCGFPLYCPVQTLSFFPVMKVEQSCKLEFTIVNVSQYAASFRIEPFKYFLESTSTSAQATRESSCFASDIPNGGKQISPSSSATVVLSFKPLARGPYITRFQLEIDGFEPFPINSYFDMCYLVGICIEPVIDGNELLNNVDYLEKWLMMGRADPIKEKIPNEGLFTLFDSLKLSGKKYSDHFELDNSSIALRVPFQADQEPVQDTEDDEAHYETVSSVSAQISIKSTVGKKQTVTYLTTPSFYPVPLTAELFPHSYSSLEIVYKTKPDHTKTFKAYGFLAIVNRSDEYVKSIPAVGSYGSFLIMKPSKVLDFGAISEFSSFQTIEKDVTILNSSNEEFEWLLKMTSTAKKVPFKLEEDHGMIGPNSLRTIKVVYNGTAVKGMSSANVELLGRDPTSPADYVLFQTIEVTGRCETELIFGIPNEIVFGNSILNCKREVRFTVSSLGSMRTKVSFQANLPFHINKKDIYLERDENESVVVSFFPYSSVFASDSISVFINEKVKTIEVSGNAGLLSLANLRMGGDDVIDFGFVRKNMVVWTDVYLINRGTLPLAIYDVDSDASDMVAVEFFGCLKEVNRHTEWSDEPKSSYDTFAEQLRDKNGAIVFVSSGQGPNKAQRILFPIKSQEEEDEEYLVSEAQVDVKESSSISSQDTSLFTTAPFDMPYLHSGHCYHLRIGYFPKSTNTQTTSVRFYYRVKPSSSLKGKGKKEMKKPGVYMGSGIGSEGEEYKPFLESSWASKICELSITGAAYVELEFKCTNYDFGIVPVGMSRDIKQTEENIGTVSHQPNRYDLEIKNPGSTKQSISLSTLTNGFVIDDIRWQIEPQETLVIPVYFEPTQSQMQFRGQAVFSHMYGEQCVNFSGTGASADLSFSPANFELDFGTVSLGSSIVRSIMIRNTGLLGGSFSLQIASGEAFFSFKDEDDALTINGYIESGESCSHKVVFTALKTDEINIQGNMIFRFQLVPHGTWTSREVHMICGIGKPLFKIVRNSSIDFGTVFIGVNKSVDVIVRNDGNAQSNWSLEIESSLITVSSVHGELMPGRQQKLSVKYSPDNFDPLETKMIFKTDLEDISVPISALTGIPYLKVSAEQMETDLGVKEADVQQRFFIDIKNTSKSPMEVQFSLFELPHSQSSQNLTGIPEQSSHFKIVTPKIILPPNVNRKLEVTVTPIFEKTLQTGFRIQANTGEQYEGSIRLTGGASIMKFHKFDESRLFSDEDEKGRETPESERKFEEGEEPERHSKEDQAFALALVEDDDLCFKTPLLKGGNVEDEFIPCFILTNVGNVEFLFEIESLSKEDDSIKKCFFKPEFLSGRCLPQKQCVLKFSVKSNVPGIYNEEFKIKGLKKCFECSIVANIGIGHIEVKTMSAEEIVDFGTIISGTSTIQTLSLLNSGTYPVTVNCTLGNVKIANGEGEMIEHDAEKGIKQTLRPFSVQQPSSLINVGEDMLVSVNFSPKEDDSFEQTLKVNNDCDQLVQLLIRGAGGQEKLALKWDEDEDQLEPFLPVDFGVCHLESNVVRNLKLKNVGMVVSDIKLLLSDSCFSIDNTEESLTLKPGKMKNFKITYTPEKEAKTEDASLTILTKCKTYTIPLIAESSVFKLSVLEQEMSFKQMMVKSEQTRHFQVVNDSKLPMGIRIDTLLPASQRDQIEIQFLDADGLLTEKAVPAKTKFSSAHLKSLVNLKESQVELVKAEIEIPGSDLVLLPGETKIITVTAKPEAPEDIDTSIEIIPVAEPQLKAALEKEVPTVSIPVQVEVVEGEISMSNFEEYVDIGQLHSSEKKSEIRTIKNETNEKRDFRITVTPVDESKSPETGWTVDPSQGQIEAKSSVGVTFNFIADDEGRQESVVVIETSPAGSGEWKENLQFNISATVANPVVDVSESRVDFGYCSEKLAQKTSVKIANTGTGELGVELFLVSNISDMESKNPDYFIENFDDIRFAKILGEQPLEFDISFRPSAIFQPSDAFLIINSNGGSKVISLTGQGAEFKVQESSLPTSLDFLDVTYGESMSKSFVVTNESAARTRLKCEVVPVKEKSELYGHYVIEPVSPLLEGSLDGKIGTIEIVIHLSTVPPPRFCSKEDVEAIVQIGGHEVCLNISLPDSQVFSIPLYYTVYLKPLSFGTVGDNDLFIPTTEIFCGAVAKGNSCLVEFGLENSYAFEVPIDIVVPESLREIVQNASNVTVIEAHSVASVSLEIFVPEEGIPGESFEIMVEGLFNCLPTLNIPFKIKVLEKGAEKIILEDVKFEEQALNTTTPMNISIPAFVSKPTSYHVVLDSDVFEVAPELMFGELQPGEPLQIPVKFFPTQERRYTAVASIITDEGVFEMKLEGVGVAAEVELSKSEIDFGAVSVNEVEEQQLTITNLGASEVHVVFRSSSEMFGAVLNGESIPVGESREIVISFCPKEDITYEALVEVYHDLRREKAKDVNFDDDGDSLILLSTVAVVGSGEIGEVSASITSGSVLTLREESEAEDITLPFEFGQEIKVHQKSVVKKRGRRISVVEFTNTGNTVVELEAIDEKGVVISEGNAILSVSNTTYSLLLT